MSELTPLDHVSLSEYVIPSKPFTTTDVIGCGINVHYISDIHLEHHIKPKNYEKNINNIVDKLSKEYIASYDSIIYIGGDVADSIELAGIFYKRLREKYPKVHIIAVLGNHEISEFSSLEEAVKSYADLFKSLNIDFLQNSIIGSKLGAYDYIQRFVCVGGIGFAPFNDVFNANNLVVSQDVQFDRDRELEEGSKFLDVYNKAVDIAIEHKVPLLVLTHYPIDDWLPKGKVNPQCIYFNGHNHSDNYYYKEGAVVVSDNQIGYDAKPIRFKCYRVGTLQNPFYSYADGYYEINYSDYYSFYRYSGLMISSEGKSISKQIDKGFHFYMIKKNGFYMFVLVGEEDSWLCVGAQIKKIQGVSHIEYFYNAFDTIIQRYIQSFASTYNGLKAISEKLIEYGFNGRVHGFIIDLDYYNHIMFNPFDGKVTFYYSPLFGLVKEYPSLNSLLCSMKESASREKFDSLREYKQEIKRLDKAIAELTIEKPGLTGSETKSIQKFVNSSAKRINVGRGSMYEHSKRMLQIQRLFECNILREWDMSLIEDLYIEDKYRPVKKAVSDYMLVKNDWRYYSQIDSKKRTKRVTLICFPILDSDYSFETYGKGYRFHYTRPCFPHIENDERASDEEILNFISSIPQNLINDTDVLMNLAESLTFERFFDYFPKSELTTDLIRKLIDIYGEQRSLSFPEDIMTFELWQYIYDTYDYSKRKTRVPNFPKDIWNRIRTQNNN